jgi:HNH endonuclease
MQSDLFWQKVDTTGECWVWTGYRLPAGHGQFGRSDTGLDRLTHRIAWQMENGPIPDGMVVRHVVCNNPPCVRVAHLALGSQRENIHDAVALRRMPHKLSVEDEAAALRLVELGWSQRQAASLFGMSGSWLSRAARHG